MTELGKQVWEKMEEMGWENAPEGFHLEYYENIIECTKQVLTIPAVVKSLPTDECVEQWWAEGQNQNEGFWQEAPYRTNGDVVEEIKTALKYFIETWQR